MADSGFPIPVDVREWVTASFSALNNRLSQKLFRVPTQHETALDLSLVEYLSNLTAPYQLPSNWVVRLDVHYLGGMRHWGSWEVADIGVLVLLRRNGKVRRSKIALLQSKRLYPIELDFEEDSPIDYMVGFGRLWRDEDSFLKITAQRTFSFTEKSRYEALIVDDDQYVAIRKYENDYKIPVHYNLYHPTKLPTTQTFPLVAGRRRMMPNKVGCRIVPAAALRQALSKQAKGYKPSYGDLKYRLRSPFDAAGMETGWRIESFVNELLDCREGYIADNPRDPGVHRVFAERGAPISAAIALAIDAPE